MKVTPIVSHNDFNKGKIYTVIGVEGDTFRIIDELEKPFLNDQNKYIVVDDELPDFWVSELGEEGEYAYYPAEWLNIDYFFEDYFDRKSDVINIFRSVLKEKYGVVLKIPYDSVD